MRHSALTAAVLAAMAGAPALLWTPALQAQVQSEPSFDIPAMPLSDALVMFGSQSGYQISADAQALRGVQSRPVSGALAPARALSQLLEGTGFTFRLDGNAALIERAPAADAAIRLGAVRIEGEDAGDGLASDPYATEGTGSYTVKQSSGATRLGLSPRETPQSMTVVTRQQIEDQQLLSVTDVLRLVPGIALSHDDSDRDFLYSRGFSTTTVLVDGLRSFDQDASASFVTTVDTATLDRVEVVRGANGLLKGVGNPSAAINLVLKRPTRDFQAHINTSAGSWDRYRSEVDVSGPLNDDGSLRGRAVAAYENGHNFYDYYHKRAKVFYGIAEYDLSPDTLLTAGVEYQTSYTNGSTYGSIPLFWSDGSRFHAARSWSPSSKGAHLATDSLKVFAEAKHQFSDDWQARVRLTQSHLSRDMLVSQLYASVAPDRETGDATRYNTHFNPDRTAKGVDAQVTGKLAFGGWDADVIGGFSWTRSVLDRTDLIKNDSANVYTWDGSIAPLTDWSGATTSIRHTTERETSLYGTIRLRPSDTLSLIAGANLESYRLRDTVNDVLSRRMDANGELVPYAGVVWDFSRALSWYASYTDIFSPATVYDRYDNLLDPVTGTNYETGIKGEFFDGRLNASIAGFYIKQDNVAVAIAGVLTPSGAQAYQGTDGVTSKGFELELSGEVAPGWQVQGGYTYLHARTAADARVNTGMPQVQAKFATSYRFQDGALAGAMIGANATWQDRTYYATSYGTATQGGVAVFGLVGGYDFSRNWSATLALNNLLDKTYYAGYGLFTSYNYGDPRNVMLNVRYTF